MNWRSKKMWLWILAIPVAVVVLAFVAGQFLPDRYEAKQTHEIALSPSELWARLHDPERFPMTGSMCKGVEVLPREDGLAVWTETMSGSSLRIRDVVAEEPTHIVRELKDTVVPFESRAEFWLKATPSGGTELTCQNVVTMREGTWHVPFFRVMLSLFGGAKSGIRSYVGSLRKL